jgi:predicted dehydrogenase
VAPRSLKIGIVGYGHWGKCIERTLCQFPNVQTKIIEKYKISEDCDAIVIASPSSTHAGIALEYIERGISVFVEKPLAISSSDVVKIINCAKSNATLVFVGYIYRYNNFLGKIKQEIQELGNISSIELLGFNNRPRNDSSILWDWLPHDLSILHFLTGKFPSFSQSYGNSEQGQLLSASVRFTLNSTSINSELRSNEQFAVRKFNIIGDKGRAHLDDRNKTLKLLTQKREFFFDEEAYIPPLYQELNNFINILAGKIDFVEDLQFTLKLTQLIEAVETAIVIT